MKRVTVIGGGAAGMMAAITAARNGARVTIIEQKERLGKKILSTGNGRCNYTNYKQTKGCYRSQNHTFPWEIYRQFNVEETVAFFHDLGIVPKERNGYLYPNSDQASSVADVLRMEINHLGVQVLLETRCLEIRPTKNGYQVVTDSNTIRSDAVILTTGSKAAPVTGSDGSGYTIAKQLGLEMIPVLPALVQLCCKEKIYKKVAGVRAQALVSIYGNGKKLAHDLGELQLTNYGISGIPVFQVSRYAAYALYKKQHVKAVINFAPEADTEKFAYEVKTRIEQHPEKKMEDFFVGMFHNKLTELWLQLAAISKQKQAGELQEEELQRLVKVITAFETEITETKGFEQAQICCGGIDTRELNPETLEVYAYPGLFLAGEVLDVDGICGGYNLQWAWSSGYVAGREAADASY